jgi:hypothetical protein
MPSDEKVSAALSALKAPRARFDEALMLSIEEIQGFLATHRDPEEDRASRVAHELGTFAAGRIDVDRFAALLQDSQSLDREVRHELDLALDTLTGLRKRGEGLFRTRVAPGGDLRDTVAQALAEIGRAFAAARLVESARAGDPGEAHDASQKGFPFRRWSTEERSLGPPLVVEVEGKDLLAGGLSEFLDGTTKLVLVVEGQAPPAALAGLIAPDVWVEQAEKGEELKGFSEYGGAGIAALVGEDAALFRHDPTGGDGLGARISVLREVEAAPKRRLGSVSARQMSRDLAHLKALRDAGGTTPAPAQAGAPAGEAPASAERAPAQPAAAAAGQQGADPAGMLAGWLLQNTDLSGL